MHDLKGKRVSVGASRSGNELNARVLLGAAGMSYADLRRVDYLPYNDAVALMRDGQLDAVIVLGRARREGGRRPCGRHAGRHRGDRRTT